MLNRFRINTVKAATLCGAMAAGVFAYSSMGGEPQLIPYSGCGVLQLGVECPLFVGDDGISFSVPVLPPFQIGDYVNITGDICPKCPSICQQGPVIKLQSMEYCPALEYVDICGTLISETKSPFFCILFQADNGLTFGLDTAGEFDVDDNVRVVGLITPVKPGRGMCGQINGWIHDNSISACGALVDECGELIASGNGPFACMVFLGESGNVYTLENTANFNFGDRVHVSGLTTAPCAAGCGTIDGCLDDNTIIGCPDINNDGTVDVDDLLALFEVFGGACNDGCAEDLNRDGFIDVDDLLLLLSHWD